ncbi:hypothetical protein [Maridesulfovibrio sp.]|uniref:hypothetical protein n=1 Tax=Maridesulfovibrio sp. TaxID=2795000 RepID=UPI002A18AE4E|nr:hypothetical protein [Maridesulfovibrio sp.]
MEISFAREASGVHANTSENIAREKNVRPETREARADTVSGGIVAGLRAADADPDELLEKTMEAGAAGNSISDAHDFNMSRIMALLSDPLLQEDI